MMDAADWKPQNSDRRLNFAAAVWVKKSRRRRRTAAVHGSDYYWVIIPIISLFESYIIKIME